MEILDIVDEQGIPTGETVERSVAHSTGVRHRTSHVWLFRRREGRVEVLLQKRSKDKDSHPGCYDISSAGHIPAGVDFISSAIRELEEELGLKVSKEEFIYCGQRHFRYEDIFYNKPFIDNQVSNVYAIWKDIEAEEIRIQESELESVEWIDFLTCIEKVRRNDFPNCIHMEELGMLKDTLDLVVSR